MSEPKKKDETPARLSVPEQYRFIHDSKEFQRRKRKLLTKPVERPPEAPPTQSDRKSLLKGK